MVTKRNIPVGLLLGIVFSLASGSLYAQEFADTLKRFITLQEQAFAITNVTLLNGMGHPAQRDMTVEIQRGRITGISSSSTSILADNIHVIDGTGMTLLPGFVMLHEHIFYTKAFEDEFNIANMTNTFPRMYLAGGVTTMRTGGSISPHTDLNIKRMIDQGKMIGPKMDVTAPFLERNNDLDIPQLPVIPDGQSPGTSVDYWADMGCTSFKVYMHVSQQDLKEIIQRAHARGLKVTGHLCSVTYTEAAALGIDNLEHGFMVSTDFIPNKTENRCPYRSIQSSLSGLDFEDQAIAALMDTLIAHDVTLTTTPAVFAPLEGYELILGGGQDALNTEVLAEVTSFAERIKHRDALRADLFRKELHWIHTFVKRGGKVVVGTDPTGAGRGIAGYSNMWTLEALADSEFSLEEAIQLCTSNGAVFLGRDNDTGTIEIGKAADLILVEGDLTMDVKNIRNMKFVFKDGIGYDPKLIFASVKGKVGLY